MSLSQSLQNKMYKKYPIIFQDRTKPMSETCMCWGLCIGKGWYKIVDELCENLEWIRINTGIKIIAEQVKEKYGSLRFYTREEYPTTMSKDNAKRWGKIITNFITKAEDQTEVTCESCGVFISGSITEGGWVYALCEKCKGKLDEAKNARAKELLEVIVNPKKASKKRK